MELTRAARYAIAAISFVAAQKTNAPIASHVMAQARGIPERFLLKVLKPLVSAGILTSLKGPNGGYALARPATQITLLDVVEVIHGPIRGPQLNRFDGNVNKLDRDLDAVCRRCAEQMRRTLQRVRITDLAARP